MLRVCLSLLAGMYALQLSSFDIATDYLGAAFLVACLFLLLRRWSTFWGFCAGLALFHGAAQQLQAARLPLAIAGDSILLEVEVADFPRQDGASVSFVARPLADARIGGKLRLSWFEPPVNVHIGDRWRLELRLRRPRGSRNPGVFDYESWLFRERITAAGYVVGGRRNQLLPALPTDGLTAVRRQFVERVSSIIGDREQAAVLVALVVGARHLLSGEQWQRYAVTGSSHLMAISGLHIGLAAGGAYFVVLLLAGLCGGRTRQRNHHAFAILCSMIVALLYAAVAGFAVPAQRAGLMLLLVALAVQRMRLPNLPAVVCIAALAIAVHDPLATMTPGFILSFAAVAILLFLARRRAGLVAMQSALLCGLLPLTAVLFARVSLAAWPVNLLAVPLFSLFIVPLALLGLLLDGPLRLVGDALLLLAARGIAVSEQGLAFVAAMPWASFVVPALAGPAVLLLAVPALWALLPPGWPGRHLAWLGVAALLLYQPPRPAPGCVDVAILDVGHGLAVVLQTERHTLLYDSGPAYRGGGDAAGTVVLPYLARHRVQQLDRLIVSHADLDHAGGIATLRQGLVVRDIVAGETLPGLHATPCRAGQYWQYDGVRFRVLHPAPGKLLSGNNSSCVVLLEAGEHRILLSGDIETAAERDLVERGLLPTVDVVIVPHHGSRTSSTAAFARAVRPSLAIVSSSFDNQWGFPKADVVARWQSVGADILNTADAGAIELRLCAATGLQSIGQYRHDNRRIWHE